jgi:hypothetical protein
MSGSTVRLFSLFLFGVMVAGTTRAQVVPEYMNVIVGHPATTKGEIAQHDVLALNDAMFGFYDDSLHLFQKNMLAQHPVILLLFSGAGGKAILYRPGMAPVNAPPVPMAYRLLKSVSHSPMVIFEIAGPHLNNPADQSWRAPFTVDRAQLKAALDGLNDVDIDPAYRENLRATLNGNLKFIDACFAKGSISYDDLAKFAALQKPLLADQIKWAAHIQVAHWMGVIEDWKKLLGKDWDNTLGVSNSIYGTRQNNILLSVMAQYFGENAMNTRLMLFETTDFTTTPDAMLELLTRVVADRSLGQAFFGNYYMMDYELMGGDGRNAVIEETKKRGMKTYLPPLVPFGSHAWPAKITPGPGPGSIEQLPKNENAVSSHF